MSRGWWSLGDHSGYRGNELALWRLECAFCGEEGNWELAHHLERSGGKSRRDKKLNYDTYKCVGCGNLTMVMWSAGDSHHDYRQLPNLLKTTRFPDHWPEEVGRYWLQAQRNIEGSNWDAAALMARSALQLLLRRENATGHTLIKEIDDISRRGLIPPIMQEWAHELRVLGNDAAHPTPGDNGISERDARHAVKFLRVLLTLLHDLPKEIKEFRSPKVNN
jgi:hypothetical protein